MTGPNKALGQQFVMPIGDGYGLPMLVTQVVMEVSGGGAFGGLVETQVTFTCQQVGGPVRLAPLAVEQ